MLLSRLALGVVLFSTSCGAFSPQPNYNQIITHPSAKTSFFSATIEEEALSDTDEDTLFGEASPKFPGRHRTVSKTGVILPDNRSPPNPLDHSKDPLVNKLHTMRDTVASCPEIWKNLAKDCPDKRAVLDEHLCDTKIDYTFAQMEDKVLRSAAAFKNLGVAKGVNVAVLGENSAQWLIIDHGIQLAGGASAVRGADAPLDELRYIYEHSDSAGIAVLQDVKLLQKLSKDAKAKGLANLGLSNESFGPVKTVILMHKGKKTTDEIKALGVENGVEVHVLSDLLDSTSPASYKELPSLDRSDLSTIVYTSGTTGETLFV